MKTPVKYAAIRRSAHDRTGTRAPASRLTVATLRIPRHTASAAMLTALAGLAHVGMISSIDSRSEAACRPMASMTQMEIRSIF